ncbi:MAG: small basic protein [Planctomycetales bacterium]|nr:small basic protein [Planctomycetales bacterium]NIM09506.1 small basic protein [Planctomycetales bacterium]NIN08994.1 small basic protein [Planctomycetales bacterium]NIN78109.1 small basic protein [Planctomycetales bacterium]NIO35289.1 small basic protein [Planctomycetales bacterium]
MTIDKSLKIRRGLIRTRNVLTRAERIKKLAETDRWQEGDSPFGLAKVRVQKMVMKKKKKKKEEEGEGEAAEGTAAPAAGSKSS